MEEQLVDFLLADTTLAALVGTRINWLLRPQGAGLPAVSLQLASSAREYTMAGREGLVGYLVQIDVWAASFKSMKQVSRAIVAALDDLSTGSFQGAFIESERDTVETDEAATTFFRGSIDARVWFSAP
jgi:hypothetical protein